MYRIGIIWIWIWTTGWRRNIQFTDNYFVGLENSISFAKIRGELGRSRSKKSIDDCVVDNEINKNWKFKLNVDCDRTAGPLLNLIERFARGQHAFALKVQLSP